MGKQIQSSGSAAPSVRPVLDPDEVFLYGAQKLLLEGAGHVLKRVEHECFRVVCVSDGRCFGSGGAFWYDRHCSEIRRGHDSCCQDVCVDGGGEGEVQVAEHATA